MLSIGKSREIKVILYKMKINCTSQSLVQVPDTWVWCMLGTPQPSFQLQGKMLVHHIHKGVALS